eukprot:4374540-Prymnesium_polylepis.4
MLGEPALDLLGHLGRILENNMAVVNMNCAPLKLRRGRVDVLGPISFVGLSHMRSEHLSLDATGVNPTATGEFEPRQRT